MASIRSSLSFVAVLTLASACASVPMAAKDSDLAAKKFDPPPDHANLYVYRNENFGSAERLTVILDDSLLGDTAAKTYLYTPIPPGRHVIVSKAENEAETTIDAKSGANYFVWQEVKMGIWSARSALHQVAERDGREGVLECNLANTKTPRAPPGCTKDTDCKGERVCKAGVCADANRPVN
jgi:hypothetical protein